MKVKVLLTKTIILLLSIALLSACGSGAKNLPFENLLSKQQTNSNLSVKSSNTLNINPVSTNDMAEYPNLLQRKDGSFIITYNSKVHGKRRVFVRNSVDGINWSKAVKVTDNPLSDSHPSLAEDNSGKLTLIYSSNKTGAWAIYKTTSMDGINWTESKNINLPTGESGNIVNPVVISDLNKLILSYQHFGGGIFVSSSEDGENWSTPSTITISGEKPSIIKDKHGNYIMAYQDSDDGNTTNIFMTYSKDLITWKTPLKQTNLQYAKDPNIVQLNNGKYLLTYSLEDSPGSWNIYKQSSNNLKEWTPLEKLTENKINSQPYTLVSKNGSLFIVWNVEDPEDWTCGVFIGSPKN